MGDRAADPRGLRHDRGHGGDPHQPAWPARKLGTVGRTLPSLDIQIADDGEILMRGPLVFLGYFKQPEATAEALEGGWLHTGDVGSLDEDGYLRITDRKKHLIITAGGKNVAPAGIERAIKMQSPLISQVHAHGDRRAFISALIAPARSRPWRRGVENGRPRQSRSRSQDRRADGQPDRKEARPERRHGQSASPTAASRSSSATPCAKATKTCPGSKRCAATSSSAATSAPKPAK